MGEDYRRVRYKLTDRYLAFWFAFILGNDSLLAQNNFEAARQDFLRRFDDFSVRALEQFFLDASGKVNDLQRWEPGGIVEATMKLT